MHTTTIVDLPAGDPIDCHDFARAIAEFRYPVPREGATGMACITDSKMVDYSFRARPKVSVSEPSRKEQQAALDFPVERFDPTPYAIPCPPLIAEVQLPLPVPGMMSDLAFPAALTEKDRALLEALLDTLPDDFRPRYPMSEWDQGRFLAIFREKVDALQLVGEQCWEPILVTEGYVELQRRRQAHFFAENGIIAIGEEFERGLDVVDQAGHSVETFDARLGPGHYFLSRQQAISILQALGFPYGDDGADGSSVDNQPSSDVDAAQEEGKPRKKWTPERAKKMHSEYMQDADLAEEVALRYGIGSPRMYQVFAEHGLPTKSSSGRKRGEKQQRRKDHGIQSVSLEAITGAWGRGDG